MEARLTAIEKRLDRAEPKLDALVERAARIEGRIEDMPTKDWMNTRLLTLFGALVGAGGLTIAAFKLLAPAVSP